MTVRSHSHDRQHACMHMIPISIDGIWLVRVRTAFSLKPPKACSSISRWHADLWIFFSTLFIISENNADKIITQTIQRKHHMNKLKQNGYTYISLPICLLQFLSLSSSLIAIVKYPIYNSRKWIIILKTA